jgi:hypothetical protein
MRPGLFGLQNWFNGQGEKTSLQLKYKALSKMRFSEFVNGKYFPVLIAFGFFILTFSIYSATGPRFPTPYNYFTWLADAFLHGRLGLTKTTRYLGELIPVNGKLYVIYPPMPAILLMPFVAIWGPAFNQTLGSVFFASVNVSLFYLLVRRLTRNVEIQIWMTLLFGFSTIHWYIASVGSAWYFAHIVSFLFLILAIYETFTRRRPFWIGLLIGASYWSRLTTILSLPFFIIMLSDMWLIKSEENLILRRVNLKPLVQLGLGVGIFVLLDFTYNFLRFHTPFDVAYFMSGIDTPSHEPWLNKGPFSLSYIRYHLSIILAKPPVFIKEPPYVVPSLAGMSIWITTPAFIYALFAGIRNRVALACWSGIIPIALVLFTKNGTGWTQFGYRYAMDFYPFLLLLTIKGIGDEIRWHHKVLICLGILVNLWGVLWINEFRWFRWW